ncbi:MAG: lysoplasmalogenase family protein [Marmoricola sp.]
MPSTSAILTGAYLGLAAADAWLAGSSRPTALPLRRVTKPLLMPTLAASLATDRRAAVSPLRTTTLAAQSFGWGGDVVLLRHGTKAFALGAGSFGVGHASYLRGFRRHAAPGPLRATTGGRIATALFVAGAPGMALGASRQARALGPAVLGYTALISAMLAHASHLDPSLPRRARVLTTAGAALFAGSDTLLGLRKFWWTNAPERTESAVMATYTLGQLLLSKGAAAAYR